MKLLRERLTPNGDVDYRVDIPKLCNMSPVTEVISEDAVEGLGKDKDLFQLSPMAEDKKGRSKGLTSNGRPFEKGNKAARGRKPKLMMIGIDTSSLDIHDPKYRSTLKRAEFYFKRRSRELCVAFGYVSVGVSGILSTAALQLATSKYLMQLASEKVGRDNKQFASLLELSLKVSNQARQNEITAWELCAKEQGQVKRAHEMVPWMTSSGDMGEGTETMGTMTREEGEVLEVKDGENE